MKYIKRFLAVIFVTSLVFTSSVYADTENGYDESTVVLSVSELISELLSMTETELEYYVDNSVGWSRNACEELLTYAQNDTLGSYKSLGSPEIKEEEQLLKVILQAEFEKADLQITTTLATIAGEVTITDIQFKLIDTSNKSLGERMLNAGLNTLIGIVSVFLVLLFISFIISLFKYIPKLQETFGKKQKGTAEEALENAIAQIEQKEELSDDAELVAVITAAIYASTGTSSDRFVVRSIKKADRKKKNR